MLGHTRMNFTVKVTDTNGISATKNFDLVVTIPSLFNIEWDDPVFTPGNPVGSGDDSATSGESVTLEGNSPIQSGSNQQTLEIHGEQAYELSSDTNCNLNLDSLISSDGGDYTAILNWNGGGINRNRSLLFEGAFDYPFTIPAGSGTFTIDITIIYGHPSVEVNMETITTCTVV